ncbi:hypothetical protein ACRYKR_25675, partial [Escherichia coli]
SIAFLFFQGYYCARKLTVKSESFCAKSKRTRVCHKIIRLRKLTYLNSGRKTHHCLTGQLKKML